MQKGHSYLLEAVAKLKPLHPVKLLILGTGPMKGQLEMLTRKLRLGEDVRFLGEQLDIPGWLSAMDIFVQPSLWEGLPNSMLEAMALGLPVVATRVDGVPEAVAHDISGLLCNPKDSQALFVLLQDLVVETELRKTLGEAAHAVIVENFQIMHMIPKYEEIYKKLCPPSP
jgi:glycosyltransferase involved in cell wall biosynthesis